MEPENKENWFEKKYKRSIYDLKKEIAKRSIDFSHNCNGGQYSLLVRETRGRNNLIMNRLVEEIMSRPVENDPNESNYWEFEFKFSVYNYTSFPSASDVWVDLDDEFYIGNDKGDFIESLSEEKFTNNLINDLIERDYKEFNKFFKEFLVELYDWDHKIKN